MEGQEGCEGMFRPLKDTALGCICPEVDICRVLPAPPTGPAFCQKQKNKRDKYSSASLPICSAKKTKMHSWHPVGR